MNNSKYSYKMNKKVLIAVLAVALVAVLSAGIVFAYLSGRAPAPVENALEAEPDPVPAVDNTICVDIPDVDYDVYVRAVIIVNWVSETDETVVHATMPTENDYTLTLTDNYYNGNVAGLLPKMWTKDSLDFYYYSSPVLKAGESAAIARRTLPLIAELSLKEGANVPAGYKLKAQIAAQVIQAIGTTDADTYDAGTLAVVDAWKVLTKDYTPTATGDAEPETIVLIYKDLDDADNNDPDPNNPGGELPDDGSDDEILP